MFSKISCHNCHVYHKIAYDHIHHRTVFDHSLRIVGFHIHDRNLHSFGVRKSDRRKDSHRIVCSSFDRKKVGIHNHDRKIDDRIHHKKVDVHIRRIGVHSHMKVDDRIHKRVDDHIRKIVDRSLRSVACHNLDHDRNLRSFDDHSHRSFVDRNLRGFAHNHHSFVDRNLASWDRNYHGRNDPSCNRYRSHKNLSCKSPSCSHLSRNHNRCGHTCYRSRLFHNRIRAHVYRTSHILLSCILAYGDSWVRSSRSAPSFHSSPACPETSYRDWREWQPRHKRGEDWSSF